MNVSGVILAAGRSTRFEGPVPKQLHRIDGEALVRRVARAALASQLRQILVVVGHRGEDVAAILSGLALELVDNRDFAAGQSTSVRAGLSRVASEANAAMFLPCDLPYLDAPTIDRLITAYRETSSPIVVPAHLDERFAPVLFDRSLFTELAAIRGDRGGRQLFPAHESEIFEVKLGSSRSVEDVDR